jgi:hypothetical protein
LTGAVALARKPAGEKQVRWIAERIDRLFPASRIVERYERFDQRQLRSTVRFGSRSSHGPLERIQATAATRWSGTMEADIENVVRADLHWITVSGKTLRRGGETDRLLDGFLRECLLVAATA